MAYPRVIPKGGVAGSGMRGGWPPGVTRVRTVGAPVVVDVAAGNNRTVRTGSVGCGLLGLFFLIPGVIAVVKGSWAVGAITIVVGAVALGLGLLPVVGKDVFLRPRRFVFDDASVRWDDPKGASWYIRWTELSQVEASASEDGMARVDLVPADDRVRPCHPEMDHLWETDGLTNGWRVPLGPNPELVPALNDAIATARPDRLGT